MMAALSIRWIHSARPDARIWGKGLLVLSALSVIFGISRFIYYRKRRDYFAAEVEHRHLLSKKSFRAKT